MKQPKLNYNYQSKSIADQLTEQGFSFDPKQAEYFDAMKISLMVVFARTYITEAAYKSAIHKLNNEIITHVNVS